MLQTIRDRAQGLVMGVIVLFICMTFALWGIQEYLDDGGSVVVAVVNGDDIELPAYQQTFQRIRQQAQAIYGDGFDPNDWGSERTKLGALDYVVEETLLSQAAGDSNMRVSDLQVANFVRNQPNFQSEDGIFSTERYAYLVRSMGFSEVGFEYQVRKDLVINQLRNGIAASAFTPLDEVKRVEQLRQQRRDVGYAIIGVEGFMEGVEPTTEQVEAFYNGNMNDYEIDEKISIEFLELSVAQLMDDIAVDEERLRAYYDTNESDYMAEEERNVNHILIKAAKDANDEDVTVARAKAEGFRTQALEGTDFEEIAKQHSEDLGSRAEGGETGFFPRGVMAPKFEAAVFALAPGEVSEPIRTDFGFHIIRLKEIEEGGLKPFEEVRAEIEAAYKRTQAEALFFEQAEQFADLTYEHPDTLTIAAEELGLNVEKTDTLTRNDLGNQFSLSVVEAAFSPETLVEGLNSAAIELSDSRIIVVRVAEHVPSRIPPLTEVEAEISDQLINDGAREAARAHGDLLLEQLRSGADPETLFEAEGLKWTEADQIDRDSAKVSRAVLRAAFREPVSRDKPTYVGVPIGTGDYAVVQIANPNTPAVEQLSASDVDAMRENFLNRRIVSDWNALVAGLRDDAKIVTFPGNL